MLNRCCEVRRGVVSEAPAGSGTQWALAAQAAKPRPLPARINVLGINHTITASPEFGDFYRCAISVMIEGLQLPSCTVSRIGLHQVSAFSALPDLHSTSSIPGLV